MQLTTTLNKIQQYSPCSDGWRKLLRYLGKTVADDEPLPFSIILDSNGLEDVLWCCRTAPEYDKVWRLYDVWCARQVQHLMTDPRSLNALDVAERHANGQATDEELSTAWIAAKDAWEAVKAVKDTRAARGAGAAAQAAAWVTAKDACEATWVASQAATWATKAIARAAWIAGDARGAEDTIWGTTQAAQAAKFREMVGDR